MARAGRRAGRAMGMGVVALALLTIGNLTVRDVRASGEEAAAPEAAARIMPALRGAYD